MRTIEKDLVAAFHLDADQPVSCWPEHDDDDADWVVGRAKRGWDGPYYAVTEEDIEAGITPGMWEEIATVSSAARARALAAHLNAIAGAWPKRGAAP